MNSTFIEENEVGSKLELEHEISEIKLDLSDSKGKRRVSFSTSLVVVEVPRVPSSEVCDLFYSSDDIQSFRLSFRLQLMAYMEHKMASAPLEQRAKFKQAVEGQRRKNKANHHNSAYSFTPPRIKFK